MRHSDYTALFRGLAERHHLIRHRADSPRFARIVVSIDPLQRVVDLTEMQETLLGRFLKPNAGEQVLVLESFMTQYADNGGDNRTRRRKGAFFVLEQVASKRPDAVELALDRTEQTAEQVMAAVLHAYEDDFKTRFEVNGFTCDPVGPIGDGTWYGARFDFDWTEPANAALAYAPSAFTLNP
jgi:hypothetical protein